MLINEEEKGPLRSFSFIFRETSNVFYEECYILKGDNIMRLIPDNINNINLRAYNPTRNQAIIKEFAEGDNDCVKVEGWTHKTPFSCANALNTAARTMNMTQVRAVVRKGEVYLYRVYALNK